MNRGGETRYIKHLLESSVTYRGVTMGEVIPARQSARLTVRTHATRLCWMRPTRSKSTTPNCAGKSREVLLRLP